MTERPLYLQSPLGFLKAAFENSKLSSLDIIKDLNFKNSSSKQLSAQANLLIKQLEEYFEGSRKDFDIELEVNGTKFQKQVWQQLIQIPYGQTRTYREVAGMIGNPDAARAVGMACNRNPIALIIPCHRVIGSGGKLTGYASGLDIKQALLVHEKMHA